MSVVVDPVGAANATVTVTIENLADDSIAAVRYEMRFEDSGNDAIRLAAGSWSQRCQPGRGHEDFSTEPASEPGASVDEIASLVARVVAEVDLLERPVHIVLLDVREELEHPAGTGRGVRGGDGLGRHGGTGEGHGSGDGGVADSSARAAQIRSS